MSLSDISREDVIQAIGEFRKRGRYMFLNDYGYHVSTKYLLRYEGELFDSKAVLGVAHKFSNRRPLVWKDFNGGLNGAAGRLERLGFEIVRNVKEGIDEQPVHEVFPVVMVENETTYEGNYDHWDDLTGVQYHYPNIYKGRVIPGRVVIYYRGVRRADGTRGAAGYFGIARVGEVWPDEGNADKPAGKWQWHCSLIDYVPFPNLVPATEGGKARFERITNPRDWGVAIRVLNPESYREILTESGLDPADVGFSPEPEKAPSVPETGAPELVPANHTLLKPSIPKGTGGKGGSTRRSSQAKIVGDKAEELVLEHLRQTLTPNERKSLRWIADEGQYPGWDIQYESDAHGDVYIEVKGTTGKVFATVEVTANEWIAAEREQDRYWLYLVAGCLSAKPVIEPIQNPASLAKAGQLEVWPSVWGIRRAPPE
jgi:hypothetical protein